MIENTSEWKHLLCKRSTASAAGERELGPTNGSCLWNVSCRMVFAVFLGFAISYFVQVQLIWINNVIIKWLIAHHSLHSFFLKLLLRRSGLQQTAWTLDISCVRSDIHLCKLQHVAQKSCDCRWENPQKEFY